MKFFSPICAAVGLCVTYANGARDLYLTDSGLNMYEYLKNIEDMRQREDDIGSTFHSKQNIPTKNDASALSPQDVAQMEALLSDYYTKQIESDINQKAEEESMLNEKQVLDTVTEAAKETILELANKQPEELLSEVIQLSQELGIDITQDEAIETASLLKSIIDTQASLLTSNDETESAQLLSNLLDMYDQLEGSENEESVYMDVGDIQMAINNLQQLLEIAEKSDNMETETNSNTLNENKQDTLLTPGRLALNKLSQRSMKKHSYTNNDKEANVQSASKMFLDESEVIPSAITML